MKPKTLSITLLIIGTIGGIVGYASAMYFKEPSYYKMGLTANVIQVLALIINT